MTNSMELVRKVQADLYNRLKDIEGVGGIGITPDTGSGLGVKVIVHDTATKENLDVDDTIHGVPVIVEVQGRVVAFATTLEVKDPQTNAKFDSNLDSFMDSMPNTFGGPNS